MSTAKKLYKLKKKKKLHIFRIFFENFDIIIEDFKGDFFSFRNHKMSV